MSEKVTFDQIRVVKKGYSAGRLESIESDALFFTDETALMGFHYEEKLAPQFKVGVIAGFNFSCSENVVKIDSLQLLTAPLDDPTTDKQSPYRRLQANGGKLRRTLEERQRFFQAVKQFFFDEQFIEVNTPTLVDSPGLEVHLEPYRTTYLGYDRREKGYYLPTSPEFALKEALSSGLERIFEVAKVFRNGGENSELHRPEFFMLEWYRAFAGYRAIMDDTERLLAYLSNKVFGRDYLTFRGKRVELNRIERLSLREIFDSYSVDLDLYMSDEQAFIASVTPLLDGGKGLGKEDLFFKFFLDRIEPALGSERPAIIYDYPLSMTPLSRKCKDNPLYGERFELFIGGVELANAYGELTDPVEQRARFSEVIERRKSLAMSPLEMPERFLQALKWGIPPCAGIALGLERLFMLMSGLDEIDDTSLFTF